MINDDNEVALSALLSVHIGMEVLEVDYDALTEGVTDDRVNVLAATHRLRLSAVGACADHNVAFSLGDTMEVFVELCKGSVKGKSEGGGTAHEGKRSRLAVMTRTMDRNDKRRLGVWWDEDFIGAILSILSPNHDTPRSVGNALDHRGSSLTEAVRSS